MRGLEGGIKTRDIVLPLDLSNLCTVHPANTYHPPCLFIPFGADTPRRTPGNLAAPKSHGDHGSFKGDRGRLSSLICHHPHG